MEVLPGHLREQLAAYALTERVDEMTRLADAGDLDQAMAMAPHIEAGLEQLIAVQGSTAAVAAVDGIEPQLLVLDALIERLPDSARTAVENAMDEVPGLRIGQGASAPGGGGGPTDQTDPKVTGGGDAASADAPSPVEAAATPELSSRPQQPATPEPTASPHPSSEGTPGAEEGVGPPSQGGLQR
jgi:hypothetical protein